MRRKLMRLAVRAAARRSGGDVNYMLAMCEASPEALRHLGAASKMLAHREVVPVEAAFAAQLAGALAEGCGSCIQIHIDMARRAGVSDDLLNAVLAGDNAALDSNVATTLRFAEAIIGRSSDEAPAREAVVARWGEKGVVDLTMATQVSRFLSMFKAGIGYATQCGPLSVGDRLVEARRRAV